MLIFFTFVVSLCEKIQSSYSKENIGIHHTYCVLIEKYVIIINLVEVHTLSKI